MNFSQRVLALVRKIPKGKVTTYLEISNTLDSKAYRAVGSALRRNPNPIKIPCHRVIRSNGSLGNYKLGKSKKISLLREEGIKIQNNKINLNMYGFKFK